MSCDGRSRLVVLVLVAGALAGCKASTPHTRPNQPVGGETTRPAATAPPRLTVSPSPTPAVRSPVSVAQPGEPGLFVISSGRVAPDTVAVQAGKNVTWRNGDSVPHRAVSDEPGLFDTGDIAPGAQVSVVFTVPGYHDWHDASDPTLKGTVRVIP